MTGPPAAVLAHYPPPLRGPCTPVNAHDSFSGARLWRVATAAGDLCLRAWPPGGIDAAALLAVHALMRQAAALPFVPRVLATIQHDTCVDHAGRFWDLTTWMPGRADPRPTPAALRAAGAALAELHRAWESTSPPRSCPAVHRRLTAYAEWQRLRQQGWRPAWDERDPVTPAARRAWELLPRWLVDVPRRLARWQDEPVPVQPCLCDVWHAHVLYTADRVTGLIDYGSVKVDHVAVDLARLLGSFGSATARDSVLSGYAAVRPLAVWEHELIADLDRTGDVIAVVNWLRWLYHEGRPYRSRQGVADRLRSLLSRLELSR